MAPTNRKAPTTAGQPVVESHDPDAVETPDTSAPKAQETGSSKSDGDSKSGTSYLNTTSSPLVYDKEGHMIGGGEWTPEVNLDAIGQAARRNDYLVPRSAL